MNTIFHSHLFCAENVSEKDIHAYLEEERESHSKPIRFHKQMLNDVRISGYLWWIYPNPHENIYSKALARVNAFDDLVIGRGDETRLVCIKHGQLAITHQPSDDIVNVYDSRLLVCL